MFKTPFGQFLCDGDTIHCEVDGLRCEAWTEMDHDDYHTPPDERMDGFWPSRDPKAAGYVAPENFDAAQAQAMRVMKAWREDEWDYCGVMVRVFYEHVGLTGHYEHALWGVERNYPDSDNSYLLDVANDLLPEAVKAAKAKIRKLARAVQPD
jgi:hypothetical protein